MQMRVFALGLCLIGMQTPLSAMADVTAWSCRNEDLEISCYEGRCEASEEFTPMSVYVSPTKFSLCAYTNCNEGPTTQFITMGSFQVFMSDELVSNFPDYADNPPGEAVVTVDTEANVGVIHWAGPFQTPAICEPRRSALEVE